MPERSGSKYPLILLPIMPNMNVAEYRKLKAMNKPNKYRNIKTGGNDSIKENKRANELRLMQKAGVIQKLREQFGFVLLPTFQHQEKTYRGIKYVADFVYEKDGKTIVEDVKSEITRKLPVYIMKKKLLLVQNKDITFIES